MPRSPLEVDQLRARALQGDTLADLTDKEREWVWRSLLKAIRMREVCELLDWTERKYRRALPAIQRMYDERIAAYKAEKARKKR